MTISRSEKAPPSVTFTNFGKAPLHVLSEPWAEEFDVPPGMAVRVRGEFAGDHGTGWDGIGLDWYAESNHVSVWCPAGSTFEVFDPGQNQ